nr:MAG TPA: hypothetical protein [Caudoviricetes sp.]
MLLLFHKSFKKSISNSKQVKIILFKIFVLLKLPIWLTSIHDYSFIFDDFFDDK